MFLKYLHSDIDTTPFSSDPILDESKLILPHLRKLTERGWWTVGSQPAVDGIDSSDPVVGWGPRNGYVFQKSFVEFFCTKEDVNMIEKKVAEKGDGWVHYYAANSKVRVSSFPIIDMTLSVASRVIVEQTSRTMEETL